MLTIPRTDALLTLALRRARARLLGDERPHPEQPFRVRPQLLGRILKEEDERRLLWRGLAGA